MTINEKFATRSPLTTARSLESWKPCGTHTHEIFRLGIRRLLTG